MPFALVAVLLSLFFPGSHYHLLFFLTSFFPEFCLTRNDILQTNQTWGDLKSSELTLPGVEFWMGDDLKEEVITWSPVLCCGP